MKVGGQRHALAALATGKSTSTKCTGRWVSPKAGLDWREKIKVLFTHRDSNTTVQSLPSRNTEYKLFTRSTKLCNLLISYNIQYVYNTMLHLEHGFVWC
jgi:hypothetical protein